MRPENLTPDIKEIFKHKHVDVSNVESVRIHHLNDPFDEGRILRIMKKWDVSLVEKRKKDMMDLMKFGFPAATLSTVRFKNGSIVLGIAVCSAEDQFSRKIGRRIALERALSCSDAHQ